MGGPWFKGWPRGKTFPLDHDGDGKHFFEFRSLARMSQPGIGDGGHGLFGFNQPGFDGIGGGSPGFEANGQFGRVAVGFVGAVLCRKRSPFGICNNDLESKRQLG